MKKTIKRAASNLTGPIGRAQSSFSDSAAMDPRPEFSVYGPPSPQGPVNPDNTPQ
jgi:hypothetical protein